MTAPSVRRASAASVPGSSRPTPLASASSHSVSVPGAAGSSVPPAFSSPRVACVASANTRCLRLRQALRSRRKTPGASSSDSKPTSRTAGAFSREVYVTPVPSRSRPRPATRAARKSASSPLCTRARKSMSLVSSATRANLLYA